MPRASKPLNIPPLSPKVVDDVMYGILDKKHREEVENCLSKIREDYEQEWEHLSWLASDLDIEKGLVKIKNDADSLAKLLCQNWLKDVLREPLVRDESDREESKKICDDFDNDIEAVARIHDFAVKALEDHDEAIKQTKNRRNIPSAAKPQDKELVRQIWIAWQLLGRSENRYYEAKRDPEGQIRWDQIAEDCWANPYNEYRNDPKLRDFADRVTCYIWNIKTPAAGTVDRLFEELQDRFERRRDDSPTDEKGN